MEGTSLIADNVVLTTEGSKRQELILISNALNPLLSPHSQNPERVLAWLDQYIVGNALLDQQKATALRAAVATFYEVDREPVEGLADDERISLAESFAHPGINAKRAKLSELFKEIGPVVRATQAAVRAVIRVEHSAT